jgi:hypothetical protein
MKRLGHNQIVHQGDIRPSLTAEAIVKQAEKRSDTYLGQIRIINQLFRAQDDSHLWPVNGKFNVTERAIRKVRRLQSETCSTDLLEYALALEDEAASIVNSTL